MPAMGFLALPDAGPSFKEAGRGTREPDLKGPERTRSW